ncbi:MAG: 4Fe-4S binding protein [Clostridiales bacterium]|nr:4Fe-4S binding protein [Clostridiales bacterium]
MDTRIYYFSATGNCLSVAKRIAHGIDADIVSIAKEMQNDRVRIEARRIGIVFPAYLTSVMGLPLIVERFCRSIDYREDMRIFAVCTCGGYPFANAFVPLEKLKKLICKCGGQLDAAYSVRMPMNNLDYEHIPVPISKDIPKIIERANRKTDRIGRRILSGRGTRFVLLKWLTCRLVSGIYLAFRRQTMDVLAKMAKLDADVSQPAERLVPLTDRSIVVREHCIGCGTCASVCPVQNIAMQNGRPVYRHHCEMCFACDEWCPVGAIQHWSRADGIKYHYPDVQVSDLL